jgi:hypothetical protein
MADPVSQAQRHLQRARNEREERAAAFWQQKVNDGRALVQARTEMQAGRSPERDNTERRSRGPYRARTR